MKERVIDVLKIVLIIILFPLFLREFGKYIDELYDQDMYSGGE